jgi:hypothetical protein
VILFRTEIDGRNNVVKRTIVFNKSLQSPSSWETPNRRLAAMLTAAELKAISDEALELVLVGLSVGIDFEMEHSPSKKADILVAHMEQMLEFFIRHGEVGHRYLTGWWRIFKLTRSTGIWGMQSVNRDRVPALHVVQKPKQQHDADHDVHHGLHDRRDARDLADAPEDQADDA